MKNIKILRYITIFLGIVLLIESVYFGIKIYQIKKNNIYYSSMTGVVKIDNGYVGVGLSDARHSKYQKYKKPGYNKPYLFVYDENFNLKNEVKLDIGYNGVFNDIIKVDDGYVAVGNIQMSEDNYTNNTTEGVIVKYNKDLELVWRKNYDLLGNTTFNSVKEMKDGSYLVVGSSLYEENVIGNHTTGGAIVVSYSSEGEKLLETNHGGPRTGAFNDVLLLDDGFIAVGVKESGTGIIFKYDYNGKELWHNYYGYTDSKGLTSISKLNDNEYLVTGSKLPEKNSTDKYEAALIKINNKGEIVTSINYVKSDITRFEDSIVIDENIYVLGIYGKKQDNTLDNDSVIVTYNMSLEQENETIYEGDNKYTLTELIEVDKDIVYVGNTNSKIKSIKSNGKDYYQLIDKFSK